MSDILSKLIELAAQVGVREYGPLTRNWSFNHDQLVKFASLVVDNADTERAALVQLALNREPVEKLVDGITAAYVKTEISDDLDTDRHVVPSMFALCNAIAKAIQSERLAADILRNEIGRLQGELKVANATNEPAAQLREVVKALVAMRSAHQAEVDLANSYSGDSGSSKLISETTVAMCDTLLDTCRKLGIDVEKLSK